MSDALAAVPVRSLLLLALAAAFGLLAAEIAPRLGRAGDESALDQEQSRQTGAIGVGETGISQAVIAGVTGLVDRVEVLVHVRPRPCDRQDAPGCASHRPGELRVQIRAADATGAPTDVVLAATQVPAQRFTPFQPRWVEAVFPSPVSVVEGEAFAIVLLADDDRATNGSYAWHDKNMDPYPAGNQFTRTPTGEWKRQFSFDAAFRTFVMPASAPAATPPPTASPSPEPSPPSSPEPTLSPSPDSTAAPVFEAPVAPVAAPAQIPPLCPDDEALHWCVAGDDGLDDYGVD